MISAAISAAASPLSELMNLVPLPGRVTIIPIKSISGIPVPAGPPYVTMFNPENLSFTEKTETKEVAPWGANAEQRNFVKEAKKTLAFDILIDGTGASGEKREVSADLLLFKACTGFSGDSHKSNNLVIIYGTILFECVLETATIKYNLFRPNGTPLRAVVSATFLGNTPRMLGLLSANLLSADLTHTRLVKTGDRLDNLCNQIYDDPRHLLEVARANNLTTFRKLPVGQEMTFPPLEK